jgi:hypothetical protein
LAIIAAIGFGDLADFLRFANGSTNARILPPPDVLVDGVERPGGSACGWTTIARRCPARRLAVGAIVLTSKAASRRRSPTGGTRRRHESRHRVAFERQLERSRRRALEVSVYTRRVAVVLERSSLLSWKKGIVSPGPSNSCPRAEVNISPAAFAGHLEAVLRSLVLLVGVGCGSITSSVIFPCERATYCSSSSCTRCA